jgi:oxygen-dependent protoporphyrinogen oxidase
LAAALHLDNAGFAVDIIERADTIGGRFGPAVLGPRAVMTGGKNIGRKYTAFRRFVAAMGSDEYEEFGINSSRVKDGEVQTFDSSKRGKSLRNVLKAGSARDLARLVGLAVRVRTSDANRFLGSPVFTKLSDRYDREPLSAHFGSEVTEHLLRPMTVRMNGAEPDEVYLGTFGTNLALLLDTFDQLRHGIQPVLTAVEQRFTVRTQSSVEGLILEDGRVAGLRIAKPGSPVTEHHFAGVVVATPAHAAAEILRPELPSLAGRLDEVRYFPSTVVLVEYDRPVFGDAVRALAMDAGPCSNAGAYGREDRHIVRYTFSGREARVLDPSPGQIDEWLALGEQRLNRHVPESRGARRVHTVSHHWPHAYCAYLPFHGQFLDAVRTQVAAAPGLALAGDYLWGVSLEACTRAGERAAGRLAGQRVLEPAR